MLGPGDPSFLRHRAQTESVHGQVTKGNRNMATRGKRGRRSKPAALPTGMAGKPAVNQPTVTNVERALAPGKSPKATARHLKCWHCGKPYAAPSRRLEIMERAKVRKGKKRVTFLGKRFARRICLCPACRQLDVAEKQVEEMARPDCSDAPRDQRGVASRLNIRTRYHG